jgi:hypothetical protein
MTLARSTVKGVLCSAALCVMCAVLEAHALTGAICVSTKLNGSLKIRATGVCKAGKEIQLGTFDGTTLQFSGINVQVVSGAGATDAAVNGKGNLIVGYNRGTHGQTRIGSHNLVVGDEHEFTNYGGLVAGFSNTISGISASVSGGAGNAASGTNASVSGGAGNTAGGGDASISGGVGLSQPVNNGWAAGSVTPGNTINGNFESP